MPNNVTSAKPIKLRYEQIRCAQISGLLNHRNHGFALIGTKGLSSWIKAWERVESIPIRSERESKNEKITELQIGFSEEIVNLLANITLAATGGI